MLKLRCGFVLRCGRGESGGDLHVLLCGHLPNSGGRYGLQQLLGRRVLDSGRGSSCAGLHFLFGRHLPGGDGRVGLRRVFGGRLVGLDRGNLSRGVRRLRCGKIHRKCRGDGVL